MERTLCMIKPDAVRRNLTGPILAMIEAAGLKIVGLKMVKLSLAQAKQFYHVHSARGFFAELTEFMSSGPIVAAVLEGDSAISRYRELMGATDPAKAAEGTIRKTHALSLTENSVHGSDATETAAFEIPFFFSSLERMV